MSVAQLFKLATIADGNISRFRAWNPGRGFVRLVESGITLRFKAHREFAYRWRRRQQESMRSKWSKRSKAFRIFAR